MGKSDKKTKTEGRVTIRCRGIIKGIGGTLDQGEITGRRPNSLENKGI
jgi:hypothetical protein